MKKAHDIDALRAEAIAKLLLLRCTVPLEIEQQQVDGYADFVVSPENRMLRIAIEVRLTRNLGKEKARFEKLLTSASEGSHEIMPTILLVIDEHVPSGEIVILASHGATGEIKVERDSKLIPYSPANLGKLVLEILNRYDESLAVAS